jgi:hypothetical protein
VEFDRRARPAPLKNKRKEEAGCSDSHFGALPHKCGVPAGFGTPHSCGSGAPKREWPGRESQNELLGWLRWRLRPLRQNGRVKSISVFTARQMGWSSLTT